MQMELANVQRERQQLEQQRKLLKCTGPCAPCACCPPPPSTCVTSGLALKGPAAQIPVISTTFRSYLYSLSDFQTIQVFTFYSIDIVL